MEVERIFGGKNKLLELDDIKKLSPEELQAKILQLQAHNQQLRCIISKQNQTKNQGSECVVHKPFDFTRFRKIHIAIKFLYLGWDYQGYVVQEDTSATVEHYLMSALVKTRLIESRETSNYHRCGRTDKGVTAFSQVISVTVRAADEGKSPLDYCKMLNRVLPEDVRVVAWAPVPPEFSARFDCKLRSYRYFFPKGDLNIEHSGPHFRNKTGLTIDWDELLGTFWDITEEVSCVQIMHEAAQHLVGTHDFRNFCKMDVANGVTAFIRSVSSSRVSFVNIGAQKCVPYGEGYQMCELHLEGQSFLWHQVRCIASVLITVGQGLEKPTIVQELLNVEKYPRKPQYPLANHIGLNLFSCEFDSIAWIEDMNEVKNVIETLQRIWATNAIKATHILSMLEQLESGYSDSVLKQCSGILKNETKRYKPILSRQTCNSLEEKLEHCKKKRKLNFTDQL